MAEKIVFEGYQIATEYLNAFKSISLEKVAKVSRLSEEEIKKVLSDLLNSGEIEGELKGGIFHRDLRMTKKKKELLLTHINSLNQTTLGDASRSARLSERQVKTLIDQYLQEEILKGKWENEAFINFAVESIPSKHLEVKREYDYVGGSVRFKIVVRNLTETAVSKINVMLNVGEQFIIDAPFKTLTALMPRETRGVDFMLSPLTCGTSNVFGTVSYTDPLGEAHDVTIKPKDINVKCPLVVPVTSETTPEEIAEWRRSMLKGTSSVPHSGIPVRQGFKITCDQVTALDLKQVEYDEQGMLATYAGFAKVTGNRIIVTIRAVGEDIKFIIWTRDLKEATGFMAYIKNLIRMAMDVTQNVRVRAEKVGQQILETFDIIDRLFYLCNLSEGKAIVHEILLLLKEIKIKFNSHIESHPIISSIDDWELDISTKFDDEAQIDEFTAARLSFNAIDWTKEIIKIVKTNMKMYGATFTEDTEAIIRSNARIKEIETEILSWDTRYSQNILKYLMIINKESGIIMYSQQFGEFELEEDLISGFLSAIGSFGTELSKKETAMKAIHYRDFEIEVEVGDYIRVALILSGKSSNILNIKLLEFVKKIELVYGDQIEKWYGDMSVLEDATSIVNEIFGGEKETVIKATDLLHD